ncbi:hypothetical protein SKDZ_12G0020 [Saccharomyces kudriavzevii ZP591]|nr:hypothetical protein SKDZ_12G0020 [Saccharomyces kudriavzevii ZP591]
MGKGITGTYRNISSDKILLVIQDLQHNPSAPTMDSLEKVNFPIRMLDEKVFAPCMTINPPGSPIGLVAETGPVFAVQVNFICGGLVLTIVGQHNTMDMTGLVSSINLLDKACHREPFSDEDLFIGNMDKSESIPLFDETWKHSSALGHEIAQTSKNTSVSTKVPPSPSKSSWGYVEFSAISLQNLKALAAQTVSPYSSFVSTDDIVTAFIWKLVSRARLSRMEPETRSTLGRAVDVRKRLGLPMTYPGLLVNMTYNTYSLESMDQEPLGALASQLRRKLDPKVFDLVYNTCVLATLLSRCSDTTKVPIPAPVDTSSGIMLSSWAKVKLYDVDFNLGLGEPKTVRRPGFIPFEGLVYFMPRSSRGEMAVALCLRDDDWEFLNANEEWTNYTTYIG